MMTWCQMLSCVRWLSIALLQLPADLDARLLAAHAWASETHMGL